MSADSISAYPPETHGGIVTSWVPLTTAFPSSSGCEDLHWSVVVDTLAAWDPGYGLSVDANVRCVPPAATTWWNQGLLGANSLTKVSIGPITCPSAYKTGTTAIENESSTFVACCPPDYTFVELKNVGDTGECLSEVPAGQIISYAVRDQAMSWIVTTTSYTTATQAWGIPINGYNIAPQTASPPSTSSVSTSSSISSTAGPPPATNTSQPSSGLSTGAKAGIGVGAAIGALALLALIAFILLRRRKRKHNIAELPSSNLKDPVVNTHPDKTHELPSWREERVNELEGREVPSEIDSRP